ncbi:MAG TPA: hypothetical protein VGO78_17820 [Acidimicrobiales bacterium]|jgi:hypothetical protein|nr:hypothetical protein [Acidimicrobiales bacterium]
MRFLSRALVASALILGSTAAAVVPASAGPTRHHGDRLPAAVTRHTADYDFELVLTSHQDEPGAPTAWVRRTDDVGRGFENEPDAHGAVQMSGWDAQSGRKCLTSGGGAFSFEDAPVHAFTYGIAGRSVRKVVVTLADGTTLRTEPAGAGVDGFRGWMVERPLVEVARVDGYDAHGRRVASFAPSIPDFTDFGQDSTTCVPYPF